MSAGFPGVFPGGLTTGYQNIGAVAKQRTSAGFPGVFPGGLSTSYTDIGAPQKPDPITATMAATYTPGYTFAAIATFTASSTTPTAARSDHAAGWFARRAIQKHINEQQRVEAEAKKPEPPAEKSHVKPEPEPQPEVFEPGRADAEAALLKTFDRQPGLEAGPIPKAPIAGPDVATVDAILQAARPPSPEELAALERKRVMKLALLAYQAFWRN